DQGLYDDARETLETVMIAYPGHPGATELMNRIEHLTAEATAAPVEPVPSAEPDWQALSASDSSAGAEEAGSSDGEVGTGDFQYPAEEVLAEFKRGIKKIVQPSDGDTHYDLGIAYKEMGLLDDAIAEFTVARQGCMRQKKEIDCLTMIGILRQMKGDLVGAIESFKQALTNEHVTPERKKALQYDLATAWEMAGSLGKALYHYQRVAKVDPTYRDAASMASKLS